jgi:ATP-dependent DNA helicase RecG
VNTFLLPDDREGLALDACEACIARGQQAFVVYPVIEQTSGQDLKAATAEFERLAGGAFAHRRTALLHGRLKAAQKDAVMKAFAAGEIDLLVATTVVEVGIDVPNASVMIIHHPERFGLAQLHQLRGRVGRGAVQAECYLIHDRLLPAEALERVRFFTTHNDGFALAEEDLRRRGPGDVWGVRQHGVPGFILANPLRDRDLVRLCSADAERLLSRDPGLASAAGRNLRQLLNQRFERLFAAAAG